MCVLKMCCAFFHDEHLTNYSLHNRKLQSYGLVIVIRFPPVASHQELTATPSLTSKDEFILFLLLYHLFDPRCSRRGIEELLQGLSFLHMFGADVARDAGPRSGVHRQVVRPPVRGYRSRALRRGPSVFRWQVHADIAVEAERVGAAVLATLLQDHRQASIHLRVGERRARTEIIAPGPRRHRS